MKYLHDLTHNKIPNPRGNLSMYYLHTGKKKIGPLSKAELIMYPFSCGMLVWKENHIDLEMTQYLIQQWEEKEKRKQKRLRKKKG